MDTDWILFRNCDKTKIFYTCGRWYNCSDDSMTTTAENKHIPLFRLVL
jgi:hypothetical protein